MKRVFSQLALIMFIAVSGLGNVSAQSLTITFTDSKGTYSDVTGETGSLANIITTTDNSDKDITKVTSLTVNGALNGADIATIRQMAKGNNFIWNAESAELRESAENGKDYVDGAKTFDHSLFANPARWQQGVLTTLDLSNATFKQSDDIFLTDYRYSSKTEDKEEHKITTDEHCIPAYAFANCKALTTVTTPKDCKGINESAFFYCTNLQKIRVSGTIEHVGAKAFKDCVNLEDDFDLSKVTGNNIEEFAFANCYKIKKVTLSPDLTVIPGQAFSHCHDMTIENFSDLQKITTIGYRAFADCYIFQPSKDGKYTFPNTVTSIADLAFAHIDVQEIWLPENDQYTKISDLCFGWNSKNEGQYALTTVHIPANVTTIGGSAFTDCDQLTGLATTIDDNAHITYIGSSAFSQDKSLTNADLNRLMQDITVVENSTFKSCTGLTTIDFSKSKNGITRINDHAFASCTGVKEIIVNTAKAPETTIAEITHENDPFASITSNQVSLTFSGAADDYDANGENGYMSYRNNKVFKRLLTKHLDEDNTTYNVAGQKHADVILKRTFKVGYNTLALPFGTQAVNDNNDRETSGVVVYNKALFRGDATGKDSHISTYRGTHNNAFTFLRMSEKAEALNELEPLLVYMDQSDVDAAVTHDNVNGDYLFKPEANKQYYLFENVDVNYDDGNLIKDMTNLKEYYTKFKGSYDDNCNYSFLKDNNIQNYAFIGSYKTSTAAIQTGDYFIQNNNFYEAIDGKNYRTKGFRGWFRPIAASAAKANVLNISDYNANNNTTSIATIDALTGNNVLSADVYNLNGQCVRKSATSLDGLPNGIYIWKGKKVQK